MFVPGATTSGFVIPESVGPLLLKSDIFPSSPKLTDIMSPYMFSTLDLYIVAPTQITSLLLPGKRMLWSLVMSSIGKS